MVQLTICTCHTDAYPNVAASAIAAFLIPSFILAAAFAHIGRRNFVFENLDPAWPIADMLLQALFFSPTSAPPGPWQLWHSSL